MISQRNAMHFFIAFTLPIILLQFLPQIVQGMKPKPKIHNGQTYSSADANKPKVSHGHDKAVSSSVAATKRLHIAHVGGLNVEIPPRNVGGLEKVVEVLIFEQIKAGHKVTLFCTDDSGKFEDAAEKYGITKEHFRENFNLIGSGRNGLHYHTRNYIEYIQKIKDNPKDLKYIQDFQEEIIKSIIEKAETEDKFDIVHYHSMDHFEFNGAIFGKFNHMTLTTMHMSLEGKRTVEMLSKYPQAKLVPISNNQKSHLLVKNVPGYEPVWLPTVYNGYPIELYPFVEKPQPKHPSWLKNGYPLGNKSKDSTNHSEDGTEYLAFLGRFSSDKGAHNAIEIALKANVELRLAANIPVEGKDGYEYFRDELLPLLKKDEHNLIKFVGPVNDVQKREFLGNALALLFPIEWQEPFGLVMIEAMSMGTPVISPAETGSVSELVHENSGRTFHVKTKEVNEELRAIYTDVTFEKAAELVKQIHGLDRKNVREFFVKNFSDKVMIGGYQKIYESLISEKPTAESTASGSHPHPKSRKAHLVDQEDSPRSVHHHGEEEH